MQRQYIIALAWLAGFLLSHWMLKIEREVESTERTNGDSVMCVILSILSWVIVFFMLVNAWQLSVKKYWGRPVKKKSTE
jgi:hypothetical protein